MWAGRERKVPAKRVVFFLTPRAAVGRREARQTEANQTQHKQVGTVRASRTLFEWPTPPREKWRESREGRTCRGNRVNRLQ